MNAGADRNHQKRATELLGPRLGFWCATCRRARKKGAKAKVRAARQVRVYGLSPEDVAAIRSTMPRNAAGVPVCPGCLRATGATKSLATDHDHVKERLGLPARETVRGFLCGPCNQTIGRYDIAGLLRLANYLKNPPAPRALGLIKDADVDRIPE